MQDSGDNAVDGKFLRFTETHVRHRLVGQLEISDVIQLDVTQGAFSYELRHTMHQTTRNDASTTIRVRSFITQSVVLSNAVREIIQQRWTTCRL